MEDEDRLIAEGYRGRPMRVFVNLPCREDNLFGREAECDGCEVAGRVPSGSNSSDYAERQLGEVGFAKDAGARRRVALEDQSFFEGKAPGVVVLVGSDHDWRVPSEPELQVVELQERLRVPSENRRAAWTGFNQGHFGRAIPEHGVACEGLEPGLLRIGPC